MNYRMIAHYLAIVYKVLAVFLLLPMAVSLLYREYRNVLGFVGTIVLVLATALVLDLLKPGEQRIYAKEGFLIVAISWVSMSVFGALPFRFSGEFPSFVDCLFESVSGFTTTGASVILNVEGLSRGLLFWRSFSHWIGGMGVLVFLMAVIPAFAGERALHMLKAETPGHAPGKLVPKLRQSSKILYILYAVLTLAEIVLLLAGGMPVFDAVTNSMSTAGTGGFSVMNTSIAAYNNVYFEIVISVFMILFGINFNVFYFLLIRNAAHALRNTELWAYLSIMGGSIVLIAINITTVYGSFFRSLRFSLFQVSSFMTSTGFATTDFNHWPQLSKSILFLLMFVGACSGSTGGGLKVSRIVILLKECRRSLLAVVRPRTVQTVRMDGKVLDKTVVHNVTSYFVLFLFLYFISFGLISVDNQDFESTLSAVTCCIFNIGQWFGWMSEGNGFVDFSMFSKLVLSFDMLLGRLELYPILLLFSPRSWQRV